MEIKINVAIITGAGRGIGRSIAETLATKGIMPIIMDIDAEAAEFVTEKIKQTRRIKKA